MWNSIWSHVERSATRSIPYRRSVEISSAPEQNDLEASTFIRNGEVIRRLEYLRESHLRDRSDEEHDH